MKKNYFLLISTCGILSVCQAQTLTPTVVSPGGGIDKTETVQVEWTVGESAIATISTVDNIYTEGFHQPALRVVAEAAANASLSSLYEINVAPNPVASILTVSIRSEESGKVFLSLSDLNGKKLSVAETAAVGSKEIDMTALAAGLYILHVYDHDENLIKSYKISKIQQPFT